MARILLADDDAAARDLVKRALETEGHEVAATQDGVEALERLGSGAPFDVLITDLHMPGLDGLVLAERAIAAVPSLAVVLMSGFTSELDRARGLKARRIGTLSKPFTLDQIRAAVRAILP